jgi:hypothetical protein
MSNRQPHHTNGPLYRPEAFSELRQDPTFTGPGARHARNPMPFINLGVAPQLQAAAHSGAATALLDQPLNAPIAQRANQQRQAAKRAAKRAAEARLEASIRESQVKARRRNAQLAKGRARSPTSLTGRIVAVLRRADRWMTTRELADLCNDRAHTPEHLCAARTVRASDVAAYLATYRRQGSIITRPVHEGAKLVEWRWVDAPAAAETALAEPARDSGHPGVILKGTDTKVARILGVVRSADDWLTTHEIVARVSDAGEALAVKDVSVALYRVRTAGLIASRRAGEGSRLLAWRWVGPAEVA